MDPQANPNVLPNPANLPNTPPFEMPSMDEFIKLLDNVKDMTDEEKEALKKEVLGRAQAGAAKMNRFTATFSDYAVLVVMLAIIICIFGKYFIDLNILVSFYVFCVRG